MSEEKDDAPKIALSVIEMRMLGGFVTGALQLARVGLAKLEPTLYTKERVQALSEKISKYESDVIKYEAAKMKSESSRGGK